MKMFAMMALAAAALVFTGCGSCGCGGFKAPKIGDTVGKLKVIPAKSKHVLFSVPGAVLPKGSARKSCDNCNLVYEDGTPAPCCRTVTKFSH